jgi:paraquat-inducible protein A
LTLAFALPTEIPPESPIKACLACGLIQSVEPPVLHRHRKCGRCGESMGSGLVHLSLVFPALLAAVFLFIGALSLPLVHIDLEGQQSDGGMTTAADGFWHYDMASLAVFVVAFVLFAPLVRLLTLVFVIGSLMADRRPPFLARLYRLSDTMRPWSMLDVFLVGALVSMTKLRDLVHVDIVPGLWMLMGLIWCLAFADSLFDRRRLWDLVASPTLPPDGTAPENMVACLHCGELHVGEAYSAAGSLCRRCGAVLHRRKPDSVKITWALVLSGVILYVPANIFPVFTIVSFGHTNSSTILGGVRQLANGADWPLAIVIFVASIVVPLIKLVGLAWLLSCIHRPSRKLLLTNARIHRVIEVVGRWSATDVFVAGLLAGLVLLGNLATIEPGLGVLAFAAVVFLTMVATMTFDQRLLWDAAEAKRD